MTHLRCAAQEAQPAVAAALAARDASRSALTGAAPAAAALSLVVCDANMHPSGCVRLALGFLPQMAPTAWAVVTCKNFTGSRAAWHAELAGAEAALVQAGFRIAACAQLLANSRGERTLIAQRRQESAHL